MKILTNLNMTQNQVLNAVIQNLASAPASPVKGQIYFNTVSNRQFYFNGTAWIGMDASDAAASGVTAVTATSPVVSTGGEAPVISMPAATNAAAGHATAAHIAAIEANTLKVTNATHTGDVTGSVGLTIAANAVTNAKAAQMPTKTIKGNDTGATANAKDLTVAEVRLLLNVADGATANTGTVTKVTAGSGMSFTEFTTAGTITMGTPSDLTSASTNAVTGDSHTHKIIVTKADVGLGNVTNDAQVKKLASSTKDNIPVWTGTTGDALSDGYGVEATLTGAVGKLATAAAIKTYCDNIIASADAMVYKGTLGVMPATVQALPAVHNIGWTYRVVTAGTYLNHNCEIGDLVQAIGTGNTEADWTVSQANIDGAVTGPLTAVTDRIAVFNGATGKIIKDGGVTIAQLAKRYKLSIGDNSATTFTITHNIGSQDVVVSVRENASPYEIVYPDVTIPTVNTVGISFAVKPTANQYTVTVMGIKD